MQRCPPASFVHLLKSGPRPSVNNDLIRASSPDKSDFARLCHSPQKAMQV